MLEAIKILIHASHHARIQKILSGASIFSHQRNLQNAVQTSLEKQMDPLELLLDGESVLVFLRKYIATFDFLGEGGMNVENRSNVVPTSIQYHNVALTFLWRFMSTG